MLCEACQKHRGFRSGGNLPAIFVDYIFGDETAGEDVTFDGVGRTLLYEKIAWDDCLYGHISRENLDRYIEESDFKVLIDGDDPRPGVYFVKKNDRAFKRTRKGLKNA